MLPSSVACTWHSLAPAPAESEASRPVARLAELHAAVKRSADSIQVVVPAERQVVVMRSERAMPVEARGVKRSGSIRSVLVRPVHSPLSPAGHGVSVSVHTARPPGASRPSASAPTRVGPEITIRAPEVEVTPRSTRLLALNCAATASNGSATSSPVGMIATSAPSTAASGIRSASGLTLASPLVRRHPSPRSITRWRSSSPSLGRASNTMSPTAAAGQKFVVTTRSPS